MASYSKYNCYALCLSCFWNPLKDNLALPLFVLYVSFLSCSYIILLTYSAVQINVVVVVGGGGGGAIVVVASSDHQKA